MTSKIFRYLAILIIAITILVPIYYFSGKSSIFIGKFIISLFLLSIGLTIAAFMILRFENWKDKRSIYIASDNIQNPLVRQLKTRIEKHGWNAYPSYDTFLSGKKINKTEITSQISDCNLLVLIISKISIDSVYANLIIKEFKKTGKPIFIFSSEEDVIIPEYLKQYYIFPLPSSNKEAVEMMMDYLEHYYSR